MDISVEAVIKRPYVEGNHQTILHVNKEEDKNIISACTDLDDSVGVYKEAGAGECTLAIIPVKVAMKDSLKIVETYASLDPGSTVSFCSESLIMKLGCSGKKMEITIDTMGKSHTMYSYAIKGLQVFDLDEENPFPLPVVYSKDSLPVTKNHIPSSSDVSHFSHLQGINIPDIDSEVGLLIGGNVPDPYSPFEIRTGPQGSPHATRTRLGWIFWNVIRSTPQETRNRFQTMRTEILVAKEAEELKELDNIVRKSINFDFPEKTTDDKKEMSQEDKKFFEMVTESINLQNGQYYIKLPFRNEDVRMPGNSKQALQRLNSLKKRFFHDPKFRDDYKKFMSDITKKGYAEKVPAEKIKGQDGKLWYVPHHGVYYPRKPGEIHVVFDCAASYQGVSLNNMLLRGPDLTSNLIGILLRFRQEPVAVTGDIETMFYHVRVPGADDLNSSDQIMVPT
ncbi:uncharacterized protein LOC121386089 [Gigantopelta aegis]|uniref:uncharacterized protein LOC121386089 n=1 Tax=Gigantopelta aegis TaxID=1735272 RepID=UPI001B88B53F|nr:uncharacterized protein LOC121386089 [Gigantopelta aegis]